MESRRSIKISFEHLAAVVSVVAADVAAVAAVDVVGTAAVAVVN